MGHRIAGDVSDAFLGITFGKQLCDHSVPTRKDLGSIGMLATYAKGGWHFEMFMNLYGLCVPFGAHWVPNHMRFGAWVAFSCEARGRRPGEWRSWVHNGLHERLVNA